MLGYRHAFHAGNHGDVLKHLVLRECLAYLNRKPKPWLYLDTHAGAGMYDLNGASASKTLEAAGGIERLRGRDDLPPALAELLAAVDAEPGRVYPGSPLLANRLAREHDLLRLYELHPSDFALLKRRFEHDAQVRCEPGDGFAGLRAQLPPPSRRGLVLIDPSYELAGDYPAVVQALRDGLKRFATGVFLIWFPQLPQAASKHLPENLRAACDRPWLEVTLRVRAPSRSGLGMYGSGVFVVNPPFPLASTLRECLPVLKAALGVDDGADFALSEGNRPV